MIRTLYWDEVALVDAPWVPEPVGRLLALLPGPTDHDACLQDAGFADFEDSDQRWHSDFASLLDGVLEYGKRLGQPRLTSGEHPLRRGRPVPAWGREPSVADTALGAALDDAFPPCQLEFAEPAAAAIRTADGHPLIWLWEQAPSQSAVSVASLLAQGRPTTQARLQWGRLVRATPGRART